MELKELLNLGFTKNESIVYLALARFQQAGANELIKHTKLHKKLVYENLERLIDKGLVTFIIENNRKVFKIADPNMLIELFNEKLADVNKKKKQAETIAKEISEISKFAKHKQEATIYRGIKGIKSFYNQLVKIGKDYVSFGAPQESVAIMKETFWMNLSQKVKANKMKMRLIFNESIRKHGELTQKSFPNVVKVRYFEQDFEPLTETNIQEDRVAIIVWTEEPLLFLIQDKIVAENYKQFFEKMWKESKK